MQGSVRTKGTLKRCLVQGSVTWRLYNGNKCKINDDGDRDARGLVWRTHAHTHTHTHTRKAQFKGSGNRIQANPSEGFLEGSKSPKQRRLLDRERAGGFRLEWATAGHAAELLCYLCLRTTLLDLTIVISTSVSS